MEWLQTGISYTEMEIWEELLNWWMLLGALALLGIEAIRYRIKRTFSVKMVGDVAVNVFTQVAFFALAYLVLGGFYLATYFTLNSFALFQIETTWLTVIICVVLADLAYYWEHRFTHRVGIAWATHSVHHSSPFFNISVAYRFGPMDWLWPLLFHTPLLLIGFDPVLVLFAEFVVLLYQTPLHTETVRKLPRWIEAVMNTPSHHRVHHGSNPEYLDTNYAGIFIIWDRMFGTFAEEKAPVTYGLVEPLNSLNPLHVWFHGFTRLARRMFTAGSVGQGIVAFFAPPDWRPAGAEERTGQPQGD